MRLIIVSNRLPVTARLENGKLKILESPGGVATGILTYLQNLSPNSAFQEYLWVGWPGINATEDMQPTIQNVFKQKKCFPIFLDRQEIDNFYVGFCNETIWPLFHSLPSLTTYEKIQWQAYKQINEKFAQQLVEIVKPDDVVWIHDYHLMLLPKLLKEKLKFRIPIGFFLHIPFPHFEIFRLLPDKWRKSLLQGVLGADLVGFHTYDYAQYFALCVQRILGFERTMDKISADSGDVAIDTFPMGIDYKKYHEAGLRKTVKLKIQEFKKHFAGQTIIFSVDRLDYTKGILNKLEGYSLFLSKHPDWKGKIALHLIVAPSRTDVEKFQEMKSQIDELVGRINGQQGSVGWSPVHYEYQTKSFDDLAAAYNASNIALITPLRDGMNLVAKEFVASRRDLTGTLILSETAGASQELGEAVIVSPYHTEEIAEGINEALNRSVKTQKSANLAMQQRLKSYDINRWAEEFLNTLKLSKKDSQDQKHVFSGFLQKQIVKKYSHSTKRLLLLDYDGTLRAFTSYPHMAQPDQHLLKILKNLSEQKNTDLVLISGRDKKTLSNWFNLPKINFVAEHCSWIKEQGKSWKKTRGLNKDWKPSILPILKNYVDRVPGSFIEEKDFCLVWHYRMANPWQGQNRAKDLISTLLSLTSNLKAQVVKGNKIVEIRSQGADKGSAALHFLENNNYEFVLAAGDDNTDEDMFKSLPENAFKIKVGLGGWPNSSAKYFCESQQTLINFLEQLK